MRLLAETMKESLSSVLPISAIVLLLSVTIAPMSSGMLVLFLTGANVGFMPAGQLIGARLAGAEQAEQFYGVMLQEEKEIITILAADTIRDQILEDVNRNFGLRTEAQAIICAVPVDRAFKI